MGTRVHQQGRQDSGIDKATAAQIETWIGVEAFLGQIRDSLKSGEFRPVEVRQVMIPKANRETPEASVFPLSPTGWFRQA